ncbi:MAG TPA: DNA alkylation repair protein [Parcubacteria group bacterium]|jgi:3-methyladenine DNA glycosylase AlkD|nr:DNA alkylation repair protein [Parcubacteria group bacterium]
MKYQDVVKEISKYKSPAKAKTSQWFFKTKKGQYGYGDVFVGLTVPEMKKVSKVFKDIDLGEVQKLLNSKIHEERYIGLTIMDIKFEKGNKKDKKVIANLYIKNTRNINNWDLVDTSAYSILGEYLKDKKRDILYKFSKSKSIWERRISIVATYTFIKEGQFQDTLEISKNLLKDQEDLIHKAIGWMLREVGKKDEEILKKFLVDNIDNLPRTTLRYAIERFPTTERKKFLNM